MNDVVGIVEADARAVMPFFIQFWNKADGLLMVLAPKAFPPEMSVGQNDARRGGLYVRQALSIFLTLMAILIK